VAPPLTSQGWSGRNGMRIARTLRSALLLAGDSRPEGLACLSSRGCRGTLSTGCRGRCAGSTLLSWRGAAGGG